MPKATKATEGFIYFLHAPSVRKLKIGFTTMPEHRVREHIAGSPVPLVLLRQVRASFRVEQILHAVLDKYRSHGEWYEADPKLLRLAESLKEGSRLSLDELVLK